MFSIAKFVALVTVAATAVSADHTFTLINRCGFNVNMLIDNWSRTPYNGPQPPSIGGNGGVWSTTIPSGMWWDGRICDYANCYAGASMTEFNLDTGDQYTPQAYDISNIQGYTVAQQIQAAGGDTVTCQSADCPCDQAYGIGNTAGTCPGSSAPDRPVRSAPAGNVAFTIVYCP